MVAVGLISLGIMVLSIGAGASRPAVGFALATGVSVATYSFFGGLGVRAAGTVLGFQACLEIVTGLGMVGYALVDCDAATFPPMPASHGAVGLLAGAISVGVSRLSLAARSLPLGPVVALRETSVIFGAVLGTSYSRKASAFARMAASALVVGGIALLAVRDEICWPGRSHQLGRKP